jgi:hypothetical protein
MTRLCCTPGVCHRATTTYHSSWTACLPRKLFKRAGAQLSWFNTDGETAPLFTQSWGRRKGHSEKCNMKRQGESKVSGKRKSQIPGRSLQIDKEKHHLRNEDPKEPLAAKQQHGSSSHHNQEGGRTSLGAPRQYQHLGQSGRESALGDRAASVSAQDVSH